MLNATLTQPEASCTTQRYFMLVLLFKGTALTRVVKAGAQEGQDAWRALVLRYEPTSLNRSAGLLQELLNFSLEGEIADIDRHEKASGENFPNNIRIGVAVRMMRDGPLKQHLILDSARLTTWENLTEIDKVRRAQAAASSTPQPMDLSERQARTKANPRTTSRRRHARSAARLVVGSATAGTARRTSSSRTRARSKKARARVPPTRSSRRTRTRGV